MIAGLRRVLLVVIFTAIALRAAPAAVGPETDVSALTRRAIEAFDVGDFVEAERICRVLAELRPADFVPRYNLACALSMQGRTDPAMDELLAAVAKGYTNLDQIRRDEHLASLRETQRFRDLIDAWPRILEKRIEANLDAALDAYGGRYRVLKDPDLRVVLLSDADEITLDQVQDELRRLAELWRVHVLADARAGEVSGADPFTPWVIVALPNNEDFQRWAASRFGLAASGVGGAYFHDDRRLTARDLGPTLRHEFWHVLHWRHMDALAQRHPYWVQEGLCALVEDLAPSTDPHIFRPIPSSRTNIAGRLARMNRLMPWEVFFSLDQAIFSNRRPLVNYAQARAIFLYLSEIGRLDDWYAAFVETFDEDPSGAAAFVRAFDRPLEVTEREFREWLRGIREVPEDLDDPALPRLPFKVQGAEDGLVITEPVAGTSAGDSGLKMNDVITHIDCEGVRTTDDLVRILARYEPGDELRVSYRRAVLRGEATLELVEP